MAHYVGVHTETSAIFGASADDSQLRCSLDAIEQHMYVQGSTGVLFAGISAYRGAGTEHWVIKVYQNAASHIFLSIL